MSLKQRLDRLERGVMRKRICSVCGGFQAPQVIEVYEGEEDPPMPDPGPGCGLKPMVAVVHLFCKRPEVD